MTDIPPIRMSLGDGCSLAIYHELIGTPKPMDYNNINFRIGSALEPMIGQILADNGLDLYFTGDTQLALAHEDPWRTGHPDGLATLSDPSALTPWLAERLPPLATVRLLAGDMPVVEFKTMNERNYKIYRDKGLILTNSLFRKYYGQAQSYLHTLADAKSDELWESGEYQALLRSGRPRPSWILYVAFCKSTQDFLIKIIEPDPEYVATMNARLHTEVSDVMHRGDVPLPSYDGRSAECFWCAFKSKCPAAIGLAADLLDIDDFPVVAPTDPKLLGHLDNIAARYSDITELMADLKKERETLRDQILDGLEVRTQAFTENFRVKHGSTKGRRNIDMVELAAIALAKGFEIPYKTGEPGHRVYVSALTGPAAGADNDD